MIQIHHPKPQNLPELALLFDTYRIFYGQKSDVDSAYLFLKERMKKKESEIFIASIEKKIAGFVQLYPIFTSVGMKRLWLLNDLYVDETMRGKGIAKKLIERCKVLAHKTNAKGLFLQTQNTNQKAQELYTKMGFSKDTDFSDYYWNREDDAITKATES
ncbi:MAG: GNAT family N-acetyltransferase [Chitinophagaceae bacterium]|nr:GNAT family N-acetyltransferase [Chitinophagaceae bacterium]